MLPALVMLKPADVSHLGEGHLTKLFAYLCLPFTLHFYINYVAAIHIKR